ncbi:MAG: SpoIIE family protein phosphatase [Clostridiales bacterium]|jgi:sigma-B regulation protein RsbU (phosphoserine phosphatase)|nr:SpoIIE family protein phosphatase [Clostridiales bacterium]
MKPHTRHRIKIIIPLILVTALLAAAVVSIAGMLRIGNTALKGNESLGESIGNDMASVLTWEEETRQSALLGGNAAVLGAKLESGTPLSDAANDILDLTYWGEKAYAFVVDAQGGIVAAPGQAPGGYQNIFNDGSVSSRSAAEYILNAEYEGFIVKSGDIYYEFKDYNYIPGDGDIYYFYSPVPATSFKLVSYVPAAQITSYAGYAREAIAAQTEEASKPVDSVMKNSVIFLIVMFAVFLLIAVILANSVTHRAVGAFSAINRDAGTLNGEADATADHKRKRFSIQKKIQMVILVISIIALLLATAVGISSMLNIRREVLAGNESLGEKFGNDTEDRSIIEEESAYINEVYDNALLADASFNKFVDYVSMFAKYAESLYAAPGDFVPVDVPPPDKANENILSLQRVLLDESIAAGDVMDELGLLGNLRYVFDPFIRENKQLIATLYAGTESGVLVSYDDTAHLADSPGSYEEYYDFKTAEWYTLAKESGAPVFTDVYTDVYGRGLTVSCAAPFYNSGAFAGVVCMDILIKDLNSNIIDNFYLADNSRVFLVNTRGGIITSSHTDASGSLHVFNDGTESAKTAVETILSSEYANYIFKNGYLYQEYRDYDYKPSEGDMYYFYSPMRSTSWRLVYQVPAEEITSYAAYMREEIAAEAEETARAMNSTILFSILFFFVVFTLLILFVILFANSFARRLTHPLITLRRDVEVISGGNLDHRASVAANDETGDLAAAFNRMAASLKTYIANLTEVTAEKERIGAELNVATRIQAGMLPCIFPPFPDRGEFDIFATMRPAKEVGGDFYDFFLVDDNTLAVVMADVSGKGVPAALFMVIAKTLIKNNAQYGKRPAEVFTAVNNMLCENNDEGMFVTAFMGYLDIRSGLLTYVNAGHNPPLVRSAGGSFEYLRSKPSFFLAGMENSKYREYEITLARGDEIFLYTDGVTEAMDKDFQQFTEQRLYDALNGHGAGQIREMLAGVQGEIDAFAGTAEQSDDITMLALCKKI